MTNAMCHTPSRALLWGLGLLCAVSWCQGSRVWAAMDGAVWLDAYQAYMRQDYTAAESGFAQLLQYELETAERCELLWYRACCLQALQRQEDAVATLETLYQLAPTDPHFDGRAFLYRYYLDAGNQEKANAFWTEVLEQWAGTPGIWKLVGARIEYQAQHDPGRLEGCADQLATLMIAKDDLIVYLYRPLFRHGRYQQARQFFDYLQQRFRTERPAAVEINARAYEEAISEDIVEGVYAQFTTALTAGDLETARTWLANLNATVPEHPRAIEARQRYRERMTPPPGAQ